MEETKLISEYNEAGNQILRLHNIWLDCRRYREAGSLGKYKWALDSAEIELTLDILDKQTELDTLNTKIVTNFGVKLYINLMKKEKLLRQIQDQAGKGGKYKDPNEDEMD